MELIYQCHAFADLKAIDLHRILSLRAEVFVVEQNCAYQDPDARDPEAHHLCGRDGERLLAYARIYEKDARKAEAAIGRVVVHPDARGKGSGRTLMLEAIGACRRLFPQHAILISAQHYLEGFYQSLGFITESAVYLEDDIPHVRMRLLVNF